MSKKSVNDQFNQEGGKTPDEEWVWESYERLVQNWAKGDLLLHDDAFKAKYENSDWYRLLNIGDALLLGPILSMTSNIERADLSSATIKGQIKDFHRRVGRRRKNFYQISSQKKLPEDVKVFAPLYMTGETKHQIYLGLVSLVQHTESKLTDIENDIARGNANSLDLSTIERVLNFVKAVAIDCLGLSGYDMDMLVNHVSQLEELEVRLGKNTDFEKAQSKLKEKKNRTRPVPSPTQPIRK